MKLKELVAHDLATMIEGNNTSPLEMACKVLKIQNPNLIAELTQAIIGVSPVLGSVTGLKASTHEQKQGLLICLVIGMSVAKAVATRKAEEVTSA